MEPRPPRLVSLWFGDNPQFARLARVLEFTARRHCPGWSIEVQKITPHPRTSPLGVASHAQNTQKMDAWHGVIAASADGDRVLLIDSDTMILRPLDDAWEQDFDMAYTTKKGKFPFNSGVVFLRVTEAARQFAAAWQQENVRLLETPAEHQGWRRKYGGCNQAALGAMLEGGIVERLGLRVVELPCIEWNLEDSTWASFNPAITRIVHIKSRLRRAVFGDAGSTMTTRALAAKWHALEREATAGRVRQSPTPRTYVRRRLVPFRGAQVRR